MFAAFFLILILAQDIPSYYIVVKPGKLLEVQSEPRFEGKFCYFVLPDGEKGMLPIDSVDREQTRSYNKELAEKRQQEEAAQEAAEPEETEPEEPKVIDITSRLQIPTYQRESTDSTSPTQSRPTPEVEGMIGQPRILTYDNKDEAFFISKETVIRLTTGYRVECEVLANHPRGISDASVQMTAHFAGGSSESQRQSVQPDSLLDNQAGSVVFNLTKTDDLLTLEYALEYAIGAQAGGQ